MSSTSFAPSAFAFFNAEIAADIFNGISKANEKLFGPFLEYFQMAGDRLKARLKEVEETEQAEEAQEQKESQEQEEKKTEKKSGKG